MEVTIEKTLQHGVAAHNAGNLQEAKRAYKAILQIQPKHPDANHNLGLIAVSMKQIGAALPLFKTALDVNPNIEQFWMSYIDTLVKNNQLKDAKRGIKKAKKKGVDATKLQALLSQSKCVNYTNVPSKAQINSLLELYQKGRFSDAEKLAVHITQEFPKYQFAWKILAAVVKSTGRNSDALKANQTVVKLSPDDAKAHYNLGNTLQELGRLDAAEASYNQAIALKPDYAHAYSNLGNTLKELGRLEAAEASYNQAKTFKPDLAEAHYNLGITLHELGRLEAAEASYNQAIALKPDYAHAYSNLGNTLKELGRLEAAEASYNQAIALKPNLAEAHCSLGITLRELGRLEDSEASYTQAIALKPDYPFAKHMLAALTGETVATAPLEYVEGLFDNFASKFEHSLVDNLEYKIPKLLTEIIVKDSKFGLLGSIMDLGCGTGLFGAEIKQVCGHLEGVDLSARMLAEAKKKNIYNNLIKQDIIDYLLNASLNFDYFVSTDVFIYIGDLSDVFQLIKSRNKTGGKLAFSTEDFGEDGFFLEKSGRYSHSKKYIESLCKKFGYELIHFEIQVLRKEKNKYIKGGLYLLNF